MFVFFTNVKGEHFFLSKIHLALLSIEEKKTYETSASQYER